MRMVWVFGSLALLATACGDDGGSAEPAAYCDAYAAAYQYLDEEDVDPAQVTALFETAADAGPDDGAEALRTIVAKYGEYFGDPDAGDEAFINALSDEELLDATETTDGVMVDECDYGSFELVAKNYAYEGAPDSLDVGKYVLDLDNQGSELHEAIVLRFNDDVDLGLDELLALPEEEGRSKVTEVGAAFALPGTDGPSSYIELAQPGRYAVVCFIPVGATPEAMTGDEEPDGPPHFTQGMKFEVEVG